MATKRDPNRRVDGSPVVRLPKVSFRAPEPLLDELQAEAERRGMSRAALIRSLVVEGLGHPSAA